MSPVDTDLLLHKDDDDNVWVENLRESDSVYRSERTKDTYVMAPHGYLGSVVSVPVRVAKEPFFRRAVSRGVIRLLSDEEAARREQELAALPDPQDTDVNRIMRSLEAGASETGSRYVRKDLPEDGTERGSYTPGQVLKARASKSKRVRSDTIQPKAQSDDEPLEIKAVITERMKEGELPPHTGLEGEY